MLRRSRTSDLSSEEKFLFALLCFITLALPLVTTIPYIQTFVEPAKRAETKLGGMPVAQLRSVPGDGTEESETSGATEETTADSDANRYEEGSDESANDAEASLPASVPGSAHNDSTSDKSTPAKQLLGDLVIPIQYSLPEPTGNADGSEKETAGSIKIRKSIVSGGKVAGTALITVDRSSRLLMESNDVRDLLKQVQANDGYLKQLPKTGLLSFQTMRSMGIDMRYNPTTDTVMLALN